MNLIRHKIKGYSYKPDEYPLSIFQLSIPVKLMANQGIQYLGYSLLRVKVESTIKPMTINGLKKYEMYLHNN